MNYWRNVDGTLGTRVYLYDPGMYCAGCAYIYTHGWQVRARALARQSMRMCVRLHVHVVYSWQCTGI